MDIDCKIFSYNMEIVLWGENMYTFRIQMIYFIEGKNGA